MHVAVTGANGFLGRHAVPALLARGATVTAVIRPSRTPQPWLGACNVVPMDLAVPPDKVFDSLGRPDALLHLAWQGLPNYRSRHHFETELPAQYRFLKGAIEGGLPHLVISGTCFEYGLQSGSLSEMLLPLPSNPYGFAKDTLRRQLEFLKPEHSLSLTWARLFYTYGPGQSATSLLTQFENALAAGDAVFRMSPGEQLRDYLPVARIADILATLVLGRQDAGTVNVCSGVPVSVRSLVEGWLRERGSNMALERGYYGYSDIEPMAFWGDPTKLHHILDACEARLKRGAT